MKRNKPREYAKAFLSAVEGKSVAEQKDITRRLVETAVRRGEQNLLSHVQKEIALSLEKEEKKNAVHIEVAQHHAKRGQENIQRARTLLGAENAPESVSENPSIIGGFKVRYRGVVYDASYRTHLLNLYRRLVA